MMELNQTLILAIAGAVVTTLGSLLAIFIKEYLLAKYFDDRRDRKTLDKIYKKYKDPILLSVIELSSRVSEILQHYPTVYLNQSALNSKMTAFKKNTIDDEHFRKYKFVSTLYRLCSFLGWLELYRQEITFLSSSNDKANMNLEKCLQDIRSAFADGQLNDAEDWETWMDYLIFREEQRGIGERMIVINDGTKTIMGYVKFKELMQAYLDNNQNDWLGPSLNFLLDLKEEKDFRKERLTLILFHFKKLLETIDKKQSKEAIKKINTYFDYSKN